MSLEELLEYLQLEEAEEFMYFENLADLLEADFEIEPEAMYQLLSRVDMKNLSQLLNDYFEDILNFVPDHAMELYTMLDTVKLALMGMAAHIEEERDLVYLSDEMHRFHNWFVMEEGIQAIEQSDTGSRQDVSVRDAIALSRMENLGGEKYDFYVEDIPDFTMDQYTVSFADLAAEKQEEDYEPREAVGIDGQKYDPDSFIEMGPEDFSDSILH